MLDFFFLNYSRKKEEATESIILLAYKDAYAKSITGRVYLRAV